MVYHTGLHKTLNYNTGCTDKLQCMQKLLGLNLINTEKAGQLNNRD